MLSCSYPLIMTRIMKSMGTHSGRCTFRANLLLVRKQPQQPGAGLHGLSQSERYFFETQGFLVIPDVLSRQQLDEMNAFDAMDAAGSIPRRTGGERKGGLPELEGEFWRVGERQSESFHDTSGFRGDMSPLGQAILEPAHLGNRPDIAALLAEEEQGGGG